MKIYSKHIRGNTNYIDNLEPYKVSTKIFTNMYSDEGIYLVTNNNIKRAQITDGETHLLTINDVELVVDNSTVRYVTANKIPYNHQVIKKTRNIYKLHSNSRLQLIIESLNNKIDDIYFETNESIDSPFIRDDISTFISYIK
jgi:hypothetical protein